MKILAVVMTLLISACASQIPLPSNATVTKSGSASYLDKLDYSYISDSAPDFTTLQLCIAENINNDDILIKDSSGSWVGPYTGNYYRQDNRQRIAGQTTFKVVDEKNARLVANGATSYMGGALVPSKNYIRFDIRASVKDKDVTLVFSNIRRLFQDTGSLSNDGFTPVGVWYGSDADGAVQALEVFAESVKTCISSWK